MKFLKWFLFVLLYLGLVAYAATAQSVSPLVAEGGRGKAHGEFTVRNDGVQPLVVTIQYMSFKLTPEGKTIFYQLENTVGIQMNETSAKVGARQSHTFGYLIECHSDKPCLVAFLPRMVALQHTSAGMQVGVIIPHSVYLCADKAKDCRARVRKAAGIQ
jgi:hypothetical protein